MDNKLPRPLDIVLTRQHLGTIMDNVSLTGRRFIVYRDKMPVAIISPLPDEFRDALDTAMKKLGPNPSDEQVVREMEAVIEKKLKTLSDSEAQYWKDTKLASRKVTARLKKPAKLSKTRKAA